MHAFDYDKLGRPTHDRVTTLGEDVDGSVRRISTSYDVRGLVQKITSVDNQAVGSGNVLNEVQHAYNDFRQLVTNWQSHSGAVNTMTTPKVEYAYADGSANTVRPTSLTYPDGRVVTYNYGTGGGADDAASRVQKFVDSDVGSTELAQYTYLGLATIVEVNHPQPELKYTLVDTSGGTDPDTGDIYSGLDRFGRIKDCRWIDTTGPTDVARYKYGYDRASNRLWREDTVATAQSKAFDELYAYDGLYRLHEMGRGTLDTGHSALDTTTFAQCWTLDETGNWSQFRSDDDGNGTWDLEQTRTANEVNEITLITPPGYAPEYGPAGNVVRIPSSTPSAGLNWTELSVDEWDALTADEWDTLGVDGFAIGRTFTYDAWAC